MLINLIGLSLLLLLTGLFTWLAIRGGRSKQAIVKWASLLLCGLLAITFGLVIIMIGKGFYSFYAPRRAAIPTIKLERTANQVSRGEHIAGIICKHCHSINDQLPLSGGLDLNGRSPIPVGSLEPFNLTPAGPLKDWSDGEIFRAIRYGIDRNGRSLLAMSSISVRFLSDEDIAAVIAYLRSQPPVENAIQGGDHPNLLFAFFVGANLIPKPEPVAGAITSPAKGPTSEYGKYIVRFEGCRDCHGPDLAGGVSGGLAPVGPSLVATGSWSTDQFIQTLRTGINPGGHALDPEKMFWKDFGLMDDEELAAIHEYLRGLKTADRQELP